MKTKSIIGWIILIAISFLPIIFLFTSGDSREFSGYSGITQMFGEITGLVGMTMFALTFILSARIKSIEKIFGGLDKVYIVHGILGGSALMMILFHPIFLVLKFIPSNITQAALYLIPTSHWSVNLGIIALLGLIFLISITLFTRIKYNKWKFSHEFLGLVFIIAIFHIFLVRGNASQDNIFTGYYIYALAVSIIGLSGFSYSLFIKNRILKNAVYKIEKIKSSNKVFTIEMIPEHKPISYKSGQFIYVRFYNENLSKESHPYSIASASNSEKLKIIIKTLGDYTSKLEHLRHGDKVSVEGPYGMFNFKNHKSKEQVWIAGGIGITPFLGMIDDLKKHPNIKTTLFYSARDKENFIAYDTISQSSNLTNFKFFPWNTKEKGYITAKNILENVNPQNKEFLICGPERFKENITKGLIKLGIKKNKIHEEAFDFR